MMGSLGKDVSTHRINEGTADRTEPGQRATDKQRSRTDSIRPRETGLEGASTSQGRFGRAYQTSATSVIGSPRFQTTALVNASITRPLRCI